MAQPPAAARAASVRAARRAAVLPPLLRALAARSRADRRERDLAQHDRRGGQVAGAAGDGQRAHERTLVPPLGAPAGLLARAASAGSTCCSPRARPTPSASCSSARAPAPVIGNLKYDAPPPPADHRELAELSGLVAGRRLWIAASTHRRRGARGRRGASEASRRLSRSPDADRAAPSRARRGDRRGARRDGARVPVALARRAARSAIARSMSATRSANSGCSTGWRGSCSWASRCLRRRRTESDRARKARQRHPARAACRQFRRRLRAARRARRGARPRATPRSSRARWRRCLPTRAGCGPWRGAAAEVVERRGGAVERALAALSAHLSALGP